MPKKSKKVKSKKVKKTKAIVDAAYNKSRRKLRGNMRKKLPLPKKGGKPKKIKTKRKP